VWLIVGLGNPGRKYASHRHNVGFMVIDELAQRTATESFRSKFSGEMARARLGDEDAVLLKPMTYMNASGDSVQPCAAFFKVTPAETLVIHDELDLPFGTLRLKQGGGHAGHNGLRSLVGRMGPDFLRLRVGLGRPPTSFRGDVADWVLSDFSGDERPQLPECLRQATEVVLDIAARGLQAAMKSCNTKKEPRPEDPEPARDPSGPRQPGSVVPKG
jgi:PTH1 family peptidyl-tRNA hydrolase